MNAAKALPLDRLKDECFSPTPAKKLELYFPHFYNELCFRQIWLKRAQTGFRLCFLSESSSQKPSLQSGSLGSGVLERGTNEEAGDLKRHVCVCE